MNQNLWESFNRAWWKLSVSSTTRSNLPPVRIVPAEQCHHRSTTRPPYPELHVLKTIQYFEKSFCGYKKYKINVVTSVIVKVYYGLSNNEQPLHLTVLKLKSF